MVMPGVFSQRVWRRLQGSLNDWTTNTSALLTSQGQQGEFNSAELSHLTVGFVILQSLRLIFPGQCSAFLSLSFYFAEQFLIKLKIGEKNYILNFIYNLKSP